MNKKTKIGIIIGGVILGAVAMFAGSTVTAPLGVAAINITVPSAPGQGYILQSTSTGAYIPSSLIAGTNVTISSTTNSITISATAGSSTAAPAFTPTSYGASTSTALGFLNGFFSTASSTISSNLFLSNLSQGTANIGANGRVYSTATSTPTVTAPITYSGTLGSFVGGSSGTFACTNASSGVTGCLTGTDWNTFNNKQGTISVTWPITLSGATVGFNGLSTSSSAVIPNLAYFTGPNTLGNVATTSVTCAGTVSCTAFTAIGSSPITLTGSGGGGGSFPFSVDANFSQVVYSTSTPTLWFKSGLFASSTSQFDNIVTTNRATSTIGNLGGILDATSFGGTDLGIQTNQAYSALFSSGGAISIPTGTFSYSTGINVGTANKFGRLVCASGGGALNNANGGSVLLYTGTTGTSTSFNTNSYITAGASGIVNCDIQGTNGTTGRITDGVFMGGTNGAFSGYLDGVNISGFGTGIVFRPNTSFNIIDKSVIHFNGRNVSEPDTTGANCENMRITNSVIADSNNQAGGVTDLKGMYTQESGNCQWNIGFTSFDDNQSFMDQFGGTANIWSWIADHQENPNNHIYSMIETIPTAVNVVNSLIGGDMMNDTVAGQPDQIKAAGYVNLIGWTSDANNNVTKPVTRIVNALASTTVVNWMGLTCLGANAGSFVYGNVPCSQFGIGSDFGPPTLYAIIATTTGIGKVGIGTSTPFAKLSVNPLSGDGAAFVVGSSTGTNLIVASNGNVGVGTSTPGSIFSIGNIGGINFYPTATTTFGSSANGINITNGCFAIGGVCISGSGGGGSGTVGAGTTGQFPYYAANGTTLTATSSLFITPAGRIGINTITPTDVNTNSRLTISAGALGGAVSVVASSTDDTTSTATIFDAYAPGARIFMGAHGQSQVVARYGLTLGGWGEIGVFNSSFGTTNGLVIGVSTLKPIVFGTNNLERARVEGGGNFDIGTTTGYSKTTIWGSGTGTGQTLEIANNASTTNAMFWDNGQAYFLGNVGIASTSPGSLLSVGGNGTGINFSLATTTFSTTGGINLTKGGCFAVAGVCITSGSGSGTGSSKWATTTAPNTYGIYPAGGGYVGIGTTTPVFQLQSASSTAPQLALTDGTNVGWAFRNAGGNFYLATTSASTFATTTPQNAFTILGSNGFTGIGTAAPQSLFSVANLASAALTTIQQNANTNAINIETADIGTNYTPGLVWTTKANNPTKPKAGIFAFNDVAAGTKLVFGTSNNYAGGITNTALVIDQSGQIGVNDTTPDYRLETTATSGNGYFGVTNSVDGDLFNITSAGVVGVGTTTPFAQYQTTIASSTAPQLALSAGAGIAQWTMRNAGGNLYFSTTTVAGTATTSIAALTLSNSGSGLFVGTTTNSSATGLAVSGTGYWSGLSGSSGLQVGILCLSATNEIINESVACVASANRFKENVQSLNVGLDELLKLRPVSFLYKKDYLGNKISDPNQNGIQYSLIADEVQKVDPNLVSVETEPTTFEGISYPVGTIHGLADQNHWTALFVQSIQDLNKKVDNMTGAAAKSVQDKWQWIVIGLMGAYIVYNEIDKRKKRG